MLTNMDLVRDQMVTIVKHTNGLEGKELRSWFSVDGKTIDDFNKGEGTQTYEDKHHTLDITSDTHEQGVAEASLDSITTSLNTGASLARIEKKLDVIADALDVGAKAKEKTAEAELPF